MEIIVSDLAKLYGISNQTLHYYEDKNILHPKRNVINNYRYYVYAPFDSLNNNAVKRREHIFLWKKSRNLKKFYNKI